MTIAFIQSIGGASGDMALAAPTRLGVAPGFPEGELAKLEIGGYELTVTQETRREMRGSKLTVNVESSDRFSPRALSGLVANSALTDGQKQRAASVLDSLWEAECRVHGQSRDSLNWRNWDGGHVGGRSWGCRRPGLLWRRAGICFPPGAGAAEPPRWPGGYPNPAPATLELAAMAQAPVVPEHPMYLGAGELTTPTGAALITSLAEFGRRSSGLRPSGLGWAPGTLRISPTCSGYGWARLRLRQARAGKAE